MSDSAPPPPPPSDPDRPAGHNPSPAGRPRGMTGDQVKEALQGAHKLDLAIIGAGVLAFVFSLFPYYSASIETKGSPAGVDIGSLGGDGRSWSAWHGFFGWFAALVVLAVAGLMLARLLGVVRLDASLSRLIALAGFGVATVGVLLAFFINPIPGEEQSVGLGGGVTIEVSKGHGIGFWLSLLAILAGLAITFLRKDAKD